MYEQLLFENNTQKLLPPWISKVPIIILMAVIALESIKSGLIEKTKQNKTKKQKQNEGVCFLTDLL